MRVDAARLLTREQATELVGLKPAVMTPNVDAPAFVHDADTGELILAYLPLEDPGPLRRAMLTVDCSSGVQRNRNYRSQSRTFGYAPRRPVLRREGCSHTSICIEQPDVEQVLENYADQLGRTFNSFAPEVVEANRVTLGDVLPQWRLGKEKLWTSGVINNTAALPYHRDGYNFPTWSAMSVIRRGVRGGHLHVPEYGVVLPCSDATVVFFEGFRHVHGVTPIVRVKKGEGYRISVVYYALRGMKNCREAAEETVLARQRRTEREVEMAKRLAAGETGIPQSIGGRIDPRKLDRRVSSVNWRFNSESPPPKARAAKPKDDDEGSRAD